MHTPGFEFALAYHRADLRRQADDHRIAAHLVTGVTRPWVARLTAALVTVARGPRRARAATTTVATMAEAQPCPP